MNKKSFIFKSIALTAVFVLNAGLYIGLNQKATEVSAYSTSNLPTTIDLNDNTPTQIRSYYSSLNSLDASERQGTNLLKNLKPILKNGQKYLSYDSDNGNDIWDAYCIVDRDWVKSPVIALPAKAGTYNSSTNKIENYKWGDNSDTYENPYVHALYYNRKNEPIARAYGDHSNSTATGMNREHIWPKGAGFDTKTTSQGGTGGARGDLLHLWAAHAYTNNIHNNNFYGYVDTSKSYTDIGNTYSMCAGNLSGKSKTFSNSSNIVFEPQDDDKGDIARACFYMAARYNYYSGSDSDGIDSNNPNLELVNNVTDFENNGYVSTTTNTGKLGILQDLLEWNRIDPPDQFEIHRNNLCYNNFTGNRNPFVDFPSWADAIWGTSEDGNYNPTPTRSASPASDPINSFSFPLSISSNELELEVGDTAEIYGSNATSNITWSVDDDTVISLDKNSTANDEPVTITALKGGSATITATSGSNNATCTVIVTGEAQLDIELASSVSVGDTVFLGCTAASTQYNGPSNGGTIYATHASYTTKPDTNKYALEVCAGSDENTYAFKIKSGTYANYYLSWSSGNSLTTSNALNSNSSWTVSIDGDKNASIASAADATRIIWWNVTYPRFACYTNKYNGDGYKYVQLWKEAGNEPTVNNYFSDASPYMELVGTENTTKDTINESATFSARMTNEQALGDTFTLGDVNLAGAKGTHTNSVPKYYSNGSALRLYAGNTLTFTSTYNITSVVFTFASSYTSTFTPNNGSFTLVNTVGTWTGSSNSMEFSVGSNSRITSVSVTYLKETATVSSVAMRLGMVIPKDSWNTVRDDWGITSYGVMLVKETTLNGYGVSSIKEAYEANKTLKISRKSTYGDPSSFDEDNYNITVKMNISKEADYNVVYCVTSFIVVDDTHYFLDDVKWSVNSLATHHITNGGSTLSPEALTLLSLAH